MRVPISRLLFALGFVALLNCTTARAGIIGGSDLVSAADLVKLEGWLDEGQLDITNVFDHDIGDAKSSFDFHDAVDGLGRTFTVVEVVAIDGRSITPIVIGGYNPESWNSSNSYNPNPTNAGRTAFLFNLTSSTLQRQNLFDGFDAGYYQTYNSDYYGPTFGGGHDLYVDQSLTGGYVYNYSYGGSFGANILGDTYYTQGLTFGRMEVFTIAPAAAVPEPATIAGLGLGVLAAAGLGWKRRAAC